MLKAMLTTNGLRQLLLFGEIGHTYHIEYTTNLNSPGWFSLQTNLVRNVPEVITNAGPNARMVFYRAQDQVALARPLLSVQRSGTNPVMEWSATFTGCVLETTKSLAGTPAWEASPATVRFTNGVLQSSVPLSPSSRYYRLRKLP